MSDSNQKTSQVYDSIGVFLGLALSALGAWGLISDGSWSVRDLSPADIVAQVIEFKNDVRLNASGLGQGWSPVRSKVSVADGDSVYTTGNSSAIVLLAEQKIFLGEKTLVVLRRNSKKRLSVKLSAGRMVLRPRDKSASSAPVEIELNDDKKIVVYDDAVLSLTAAPAQSPEATTSDVKVELLQGRADIVEAKMAEPERVEALSLVETQSPKLRAPELVFPEDGASLSLPADTSWPTTFRWRNLEADKNVVFRWRKMGEVGYSEEAVIGESVAIDALPEGRLEWTVLPQNSELLDETPTYRNVVVKKWPAPETPRASSAQIQKSRQRRVVVEIENRSELEGKYECRVLDQNYFCDPTQVSVPQNARTLSLRFVDVFGRRSEWSKELRFENEEPQAEPVAAPLAPQAPKLEPVYEIEIDEDEEKSTDDDFAWLQKVWAFLVNESFAENLSQPAGQISWAPDRESVSYEVKVFSTRDFSGEPVLIRKLKTPRFSFRNSSLAEGRYWIQVRAVAANGLMSDPSVAELVVRRRLVTKAVPEEPVTPPEPPASINPSAALYFGGLGKNAKLVTSFGIPPVAFRGFETRVGWGMTRDVVQFEQGNELTYFLHTGHIEILAPRWKLTEKMALRISSGYDFSRIPWFGNGQEELVVGIHAVRASAMGSWETGERSSLRLGARYLRPFANTGEGSVSSSTWLEFPLIFEFHRSAGIGYSLYSTYDSKLTQQTLNTERRDIVDRGLKIGFQIEGVSQ